MINSVFIAIATQDYVYYCNAVWVGSSNGAFVNTICSFVISAAFVT